LELGQSLEDAGVAAIIFTDIARDGAKAGVNIAAIEAFAKSVSTPVIASGGVTSLDDLRAVKALEQDGVIGVIAGRVFYDGQLDVEAALKLVAA
jgi:phosphoribosylformimino-5-aminoimidazole carboxamide ribotide isomerase